LSAGADVFIKNDRAPFVFFQGHPEYGQDSLLKEYKRDLRRFFNGTRDEYPTAPNGYFRQQPGALLEQIRRHALQDPGRARANGNMLDQALALANAGKASADWAYVATAIYANWMAAFVLGARQADACSRSLVNDNIASRRLPTPELLVGK
jgi:homoserine O-succinyltransferase